MQGKSYIIAVFCVARCILYPNTKVVIASGTRGQARLIITEKVMDLMRESPMVNREIKEVKTGANDTQAIFHNGSKIFAVVSNDNARGFRGNILIVDEFRLVSKDIVDKVNKVKYNAYYNGLNIFLLDKNNSICYTIFKVKI